MKIGIAVSFFDFRNDVRNLISELSQLAEVVVYCLPNDRELVQDKLNENVELRVIDEKKLSLTNKILLRCYQLFKRLPKSKQNYYLMEHFKISLQKNEALKKKAQTFLKISSFFPDIMSYDTYLSGLSYSGNTDIEDIDHMLFFTDIIDDAFFSRVIKENKHPLVYVYSWDHPCKHYRYSQKVDYLVWSEGLNQDLQALQGVDKDRINIFGASQFCYVDMYRTAKSQLRSSYDFNYIYFGCAIGIPQLVPEEISVIKQLAKTIRESDSDVKLVVRPYPVLNDWGYYEELNDFDDVIIDDAYRTMDLSVKDADIMDKFNKITHASAFMHMGTTLGYEACFTDTPSFIIDYGYKITDEAVSVKHFIHQYQNDKYFFQEGSDNIIDSDENLLKIVDTLQEQLDRYLTYNKKVASDVEVQSFTQLAKKLIQQMRAYN